MLGFNQAGGYVGKSFWEFAPIGRPNIYPPLLHIFMLDFYKLGLSKIFIARFLDFLSYPLLLAVIFFVLSRLFSKRLAFFALVMLTSSFSLYLSTINMISFSLAFVLFMLAVFFLEKDKLLSASLFMGLCFYTHTFMSFMGILSIFLYGLFNDAKSRSCIRVICASLILALPLLAHQFRNLEYFSYVDVIENYTFEVSILLIIGAIFGTVISLKDKGRAYLFLSILLGMIPFYFTHKARYFSGHGMLGFIFVSAIFIDKVYHKFTHLKPRPTLRNAVFIIVFFFVFGFLNPILYIDNINKNARLGVFNSWFSKTLLPNSDLKNYANAVSVYSPKFTDEVVNVIKSNTQKDEIIYCNLSYAAGMFSVFSDRATSVAMVSEIKPFQYLDQIAQARLVIWLKDERGAFPPALKEAILRYNLEPLSQTQIAYIYKNNNALAKVRITKAIIPLYVINLILFTIFLLVIYDLLRKSPTKIIVDKDFRLV